MAQDLKYDTKIRDLVLEFNNDGTVKDFILTDKPDAQNGAIILEYQCFNFSNPILGIGIGRDIGGKQSDFIYDLNRWKSQVISDGAISAYWQNVLGQLKFAIDYGN